MTEFIAVALSWPTFAMIAFMWLGGLLIDQQMNDIPIKDLLIQQTLAYIFCSPLAIVLTGINIFMIDMSDEFGRKLFLSTFTLVLYCLVIYYKSSISPLNEDDEFADSRALKLGLLIATVAIVWLLGS